MKDQLEAQPITTSAWPVQPLGKVAKFLGGGTPSKSRSDFWDGDIPWVSPKDMKFDNVSNSIDKITAHAVAGSAAKMIPANSLLIVVRSGILARTVPTALTGRELAINQDLKAICPSKKLHPRFLAHFMRAAEGQILATVSRGATVHRLSTDVLKSLEIPLPPLEEQKRIVAVLDQAFAALGRARAHAEANLADAGELFDNTLNALFAGLAETESVVTLAEAVHPDCKLSYGIVQPGDEVDGGLPVVRPVDLKRRVITLDGIKTIDPTRADGYARTKLLGGELLLCVRGSTGEVSVASEELAQANVTRGIVPIRFEPEKVDSSFAYFQMRSRYARDQILEKTYGAALMQINIKDLRQLRFVVPPLSFQKKVAAAAEDLFGQSCVMIENYQAKSANIAHLRQSLLQKAFSGQLT